jgi:ABC-type branched-subunit amino acid transport system substrate-binding protein
MQPTRFGIPRLLQAAALALACAAAAQAQEPSPGITADTVKIGITAPLTGPAAIFSGVAEGVRVRIEAANAAGGVTMADGATRNIELIVEDDALDPQRSLSNVRKLVERDEVFAIVATAATPNNLAIGRYTQRNGIPNVFMYSGVHELNGPEWEMGFVPAFPLEARAFTAYLLEHKPEAKVALLYLNTETGEIFSEAFDTAVEGTGIEIVARQAVTTADPTVETQLSTLRASGADTLVVIAAARQGAEAVRYAAESGWHPTTLVSNIASSVAALTPAGLDNAKGIVSSAFLKPVYDETSTGDAGIDQYLADRAAAGAKFSVGDTIGLTGYAIGDALVKALGAAEAPTREALMQALRNMDGWENPVLLDGILLRTIAGSDVYPIEALQLLQFDGAKYQPVGDLMDLEGTSAQTDH